MTGRWDRFDPENAWNAWQPARAGDWDLAAASHLHRRAGFGASWQTLETDIAGTHTEAVDRIFESEDSPAFVEDEERMGDALAAGGDSVQLAAWWVLRMAQTRTPAREKATLFWHGHFATSAAKVNEARLMLAQNRLLREHALGPFEPMIQRIAEDPAMLIWLDSRESRRASPNENFARELLELFCLGTGNYTEQDIRELARCFTGFEIRYSRFRFNQFQHDGGSKRFLDVEGPMNGSEAVHAVVGQKSCPRFLTAKLLRFYVADDFPAESPLVDSLASGYRDNGLDTGWLVRRIVASDLFFSPECRGSRIAGPVEMAVGLMRRLAMRGNVQTLADSIGELGQLPFFPPSVKGWNGGEEWINAQTLLGRANLVLRLIGENGSTIRLPVPASPSREPKLAVQQLCQLMLAQPMPGKLAAEFEKLCLGSGLSGREFFLRAIPVLATLPEFHLC